MSLALVTGGGGFLGRYIVEKLLARGLTVRVLSRGRYPELEHLGCECIQGDLCYRESVHRSVSRCRHRLPCRSTRGSMGQAKGLLLG